MATQIYLGYPPEKIKKWIKEYYKPVEPEPSGPITHMVFSDGTDSTYYWTNIDTSTITDAGLAVWDEFGYQYTKWNKYPVELSVGADVGMMAFSGEYNLETGENYSELKHITVLDGVSTLDNGAFCNNPKLESVVLPASINDMYIGVFEGCNSLTSVVFEGKTLDEVQSMNEYPWGINNTGIISVR